MVVKRLKRGGGIGKSHKGDTICGQALKKGGGGNLVHTCSRVGNLSGPHLKGQQSFRNPTYASSAKYRISLLENVSVFPCPSKVSLAFAKVQEFTVTFVKGLNWAPYDYVSFP